jgi:hypothetical protein
MEALVTSFTFTAEQIRSAPVEVRRWFENEIATAFAMAAQQHAPAHTAELAACTPQEALRLFELIKEDFAATQVFLELARQSPIGRGTAPLHALSIGEIKHHLRFTDERLVDGFRSLNQAFQQIRHQHEAALFGFDQANHVYVHEVTHRSLGMLWEELVQLRSAEAADSSEPTPPPTFGFTPPDVGPSEDIAAH